VGVQIFGGDTPYDDDDLEADKIYQAIDDRMDARRKRRCVSCLFSETGGGLEPSVALYPSVP
jgi:hypothetical protein